MSSFIINQSIFTVWERGGYNLQSIIHEIQYNSSLILQGEGGDYQDFVGIVLLLLINSTISFIEENNAGNAAAALMARLAPKAKVIPLFTDLTVATYITIACFCFPFRFPTTLLYCLVSISFDI